MKTNKFTIIMAVMFSFLCMQSDAQQITYKKLPTNAVMLSAGCNTCGANWLDLSGLYANSDGIYANSGMVTAPTCNQMDCFHTKAISIKGFGFNIPSNYTILGIKVKMNVYTDSVGCVKDTILKLMKNGIPIGSNKKNGGCIPIPFPFPPFPVDTNRVFGSATDLWGTQWTAADINNSNFGIKYMATRTDAIGPVPKSTTVRVRVKIGFVTITVTVTHNGNISTEERTLYFSEPNLNVFPNPVKDVVNISSATKLSGAEIKIINTMGQLVMQKNTDAGNESESLQIETATLTKGMYLIQVNSNGQTITKRFVKE